MLTYPKSTLGILRMLMHLSLGHVTLLLEKFHPTISNWTYGTGQLRLTLGFAPNF